MATSMVFVVVLVSVVALSCTQLGRLGVLTMLTFKAGGGVLEMIMVKEREEKVELQPLRIEIGLRNNTIAG